MPKLIRLYLALVRLLSFVCTNLIDRGTRKEGRKVLCVIHHLVVFYSPQFCLMNVFVKFISSISVKYGDSSPRVGICMYMVQSYIYSNIQTR